MANKSFCPLASFIFYPNRFIKMKKILILSCFSLLASVVKAQITNFSMTPDTAIVDGKATFDDILQQEIKIKNSEATDRKFVWERTTVNTPFGWTSTICDPVACRPSSTSIAEFELKANESYTMLFDVSTDGAPGSGYYLLKLYEKGKPNQYTIGKYRFNATLVNTKDASDDAQVSVFPNPAKDFFILKSSLAFRELRLCSADGRMIRSYTNSEDGRYSVEGLREGVYMVQILGKNSVRIATKKLVIN